MFSVVKRTANLNRWTTAPTATCASYKSFIPACRFFSVTLRPASQKSSPTSSSSASSPPPSTILVDGKEYPRDSLTNIPDSILAKLPRRLHQQPDHPLGILRSIIESHFNSYTPLSPNSAVVSVVENFDELGFAPDHPGRSVTDSYYINKSMMLRTHTSAHEIAAFRSDHDAWLLSADVYRRDEIDSSHYPVFHQMEGARVWDRKDLPLLKALNAKMAQDLEGSPLVTEDVSVSSDSNPYQAEHDPELAAEIAQNLKHSLNSMILRLFGHGVAASAKEPLRVRWIEAFFPFTSPSYEVEIWWGGEWLEILGSGVIMQQTLKTAGVPHKAGWAFGLGLERIAMILFSIPDIRLFWSQDPRFAQQFKAGQISTFQPYSKYPPCPQDVSFWLPPAVSTQDQSGAKAAGGGGVTRFKPFHENDFCEIVRDVAGDLVENVQLVSP